ncbi:MAG: transporter, partial [Caulobacteraceae bacterium]|nr:transporter [Caulobacter sp.]
HAQAATDAIEAKLRRLEALVEAQGRQIAAQQQELDDQARQLHERPVATVRDAERAQAPGPVAQAPAAATGPAEAPSTPPRTSISSLPIPSGPVGEPAPEQARPLAIAAVPVEAGVLTPKGHLVLDTSADFSRFSSDRLVFRGVEITPGVQLGIIEANSAAANTYVATEVVRYGLLNRLEAEIRFPYLYTTERVAVVQQRDDTVTRSLSLRGQGLGDIEGSLRYQFNNGGNGLPIFLGSLRVKSDTGDDPYRVHYDSFGVAQSLPTGSGTWAAGPGLTVLYPTDPVVLFGSVSYLYPFATHEDRQIGDLFVGLVRPGYTAETSLGFGFALNPRFSVSTGLKYDYMQGSHVKLNGLQQRSPSLQIGTALFAMSFRINDRTSINVNAETGLTSDAPDFRAVFRIPYAF